MKWLKKLIDWIMRILFTYRKFTPIKYGLLYNWPVVTDARGIAPSGWHVPSKTEIESLIAELGGLAGLSEKMRETGTTYWQSPNTGATNSSGWDGRGSGHRIHNTGAFAETKIAAYITSSTGPTFPWSLQLQVTNSELLQQVYAKEGISIRLLMDGVNPTDPGKMADYDGNIYPTVKIGTQVWMKRNLIVKHYNNGDAIPEVTVNADWAALTSGAWCYYDNDSGYM